MDIMAGVRAGQRSMGVFGQGRAAVVALVAACGNAVASASCSTHFAVPSEPPKLATDLNGIQLPDVCIPGSAGSRHHVYAIGDWGGIVRTPGAPPVPADHRSKFFPFARRKLVEGVDDRAQQRVADQMRLRAATAPPDYILNAGDNFYWGGLRVRCGLPASEHVDTGQFGPAFEAVYTGHEIDGKPWLGVLGNHDYGGFTFTSGWDQMIAYTWGGNSSTGRWRMPAQYWRVKVHYHDFSVDYFFVDTNIFETFPVEVAMGHNLCGWEHTPPDASCGASGPRSLAECNAWFQKLWADQLQWIEKGLAASTADWQIVVTHIPPEAGTKEWKRLSELYGIDLFVTGHRHCQEVHPGHPEGLIGKTTYVVAGGGGGITSESTPDVLGRDDQYGFMDLTLSKESIVIDVISHGGFLRKSATIRKVERKKQASFV